MLYRVDFVPNTDDLFLRKYILKQQKELGGYLFDSSNMIYVTRPLPQDKMEFTCKSRDDTVYKLTVKNTGKSIETTDNMAMQVLNVILRRAMEGLQMQLLGRNLYDPKSKVRHRVCI